LQLLGIIHSNRNNHASIFAKLSDQCGRHSRSSSRDQDRIEGCVGTLSMPIREKGTGEVIFSLGGVRRCAGARSEAGEIVEKGAEVVIERYDKGIAYVKRWDDFTK